MFLYDLIENNCVLNMVPPINYRYYFNICRYYHNEQYHVIPTVY